GPDGPEDDAFPGGTTALELAAGCRDVTQGSAADVHGGDAGERAEAEQGEHPEPERVLRATVGQPGEVLVRRGRRSPGRPRRVDLVCAHGVPRSAVVRR